MQDHQKHGVEKLVINNNCMTNLQLIKEAKYNKMIQWYIDEKPKDKK